MLTITEGLQPPDTRNPFFLQLYKRKQLVFALRRDESWKVSLEVWMKVAADNTNQSDILNTIPSLKSVL